MVSFNKIREFISYDPETGVFRWMKTLPYTSAVRPGDRAGKIGKGGYRYIRFARGEYRAANLAWFFVHGEWPPENGLSVDHINGVRADDRIANLRTATVRQNMANRGAHKNTSSRFKGVTFNKVEACWQAGIKIDGNSRYLGLYVHEEDAARVYDAFAKLVHGEFARLNFPVVVG